MWSQFSILFLSHKTDLQHDLQTWCKGRLNIQRCRDRWDILMGCTRVSSSIYGCVSANASVGRLPPAFRGAMLPTSPTDAQVFLFVISWLNQQADRIIKASSAGKDGSVTQDLGILVFFLFGHVKIGKHKHSDTQIWVSVDCWGLSDLKRSESKYAKHDNLRK